MVSSIDSGINAVKLFNAANAFKSNPVKHQELSEENFSAQSGVDIRENSFLNDIDVEEIKEFARQAGEENFSEDDIKYGLKYGRSVLLDCSA